MVALQEIESAYTSQWNSKAWGQYCFLRDKKNTFIQQAGNKCIKTFAVQKFVKIDILNK